MRAISLICSFLALHFVSCSDAKPTFGNLPNEILHEILGSNNVDFCEYAHSVDKGVITPASPEIENIMLAKAAEEERNLKLDDDTQRFRKQQILRSVRALARIHSTLPVVCKTTDTEKLVRLAEKFESTYRHFSSFSGSPTWEKACMGGLFRRNILSKLLPHLSDDFRQNTREILLQTAFFVGDIDSLDAITEFFGIPKEKVLNTVSELDIVFSGSVNFFDELLKRLPTVMEKRWPLIEETSSLKRLGILTRLLEGVNYVERHELNSILDSFLRFKMYNDNSIERIYNTQDKLFFVLKAAAQHGHLPIIRFLWPALGKARSKADSVVQAMMTEAGWNNHRSVLEFLLWHSGPLCMRIAQKYVNDAFEAAVGGGYVELMNFLREDDTGSNPVVHGLGLITLKHLTLRRAAKNIGSLSGIRHLVRLKKEGDSRFADFELVDQRNTVLWMACEAGNYDLVEYLVEKDHNGQFIFPLTNPAALNNAPLVNACRGGHLQIVKKLLERDASGDYIYKGIDPCCGICDACSGGHFRVVEFLLAMKDGEYILPKMNGADLALALRLAVQGNYTRVVRFLLKINDGNYVLPGMNDVDITHALFVAIRHNQIEMVRFLLKRALDRSYLLPGIEVTEDMLTTPYIDAEMTEHDQSPEMRELLGMHLGQRGVDE